MTIPPDAMPGACHPFYADTAEGRAWAECTCTRCGSTHQCTPWSDFYTIPDDPEALLCESCFAAHIALPMRRVQREGSE